MSENEFPPAPRAPLPLSQQAMALRAGELPAGYPGQNQGAPYLDGLNAAQSAAVHMLDGPVLMLAGAGTGKTRALTARIVHILRQRRAFASQILAVTFTNKAAREMKTRIAAMQGEGGEGLAWMGTFHYACVRILRRYGELVGLRTSFTILDTDEQLRLIRQILKAEIIDTKRWSERWFLNYIDYYKNRAWTPDTVPEGEAKSVWLVPNSGVVSVQSGGQGSQRTTVDVYRLYQERLHTINACDFGDLLLHCVQIFKTHPDVLAEYQRRFRYILVDEYQDTNVAQYLWLRLLVGPEKNICCVGDDDQSIYGWRGAEVDNILRFEADFPGAHVVKLEQNYRSGQHILGAANAVIAQNKGRLGKTLFTEKQGEKLRLTGYWDGEEEARAIGETIEAAQRGRDVPRAYGLDDMAILVRASHQMRAFEDRFLTIGLPYRVIGGPRFYERAEIRDAMAYFRLVISPSDDLAFERIVNLPKRGLGDVALQKIQTTARGLGLPLLEGARALLAKGGLGGKGAVQLRLFIEQMDRWHAAVLDGGAAEVVEGLIAPSSAPHATSHVQLAQVILDESGYTALWQNEKTPEAEGRLENLKELIKALDGFDSLQGFLEHVSLIMENDSQDASEKVTIMTLHAAKGLEYPIVFLPGWEEGLFPSQRSMDESGPKGLEEERRLAYVGITRAEELCCISFASNRRVYGQWQSQLPSRFIDELPADHVDVRTAPALYGGGFGAAAPSFGAPGLGDFDPSPAFDARVASADSYDSPGWRRMQGRSAERGFSAPRAARPITIEGEAMSAYGRGDRVFHQKFGYGEVVATEGNKLVIEFDHAGEKHIVATWVVPAHQAEGDVPF